MEKLLAEYSRATEPLRERRGQKRKSDTTLLSDDEIRASLEKFR
jgi:hypothetical protein